MTRPVAYDYDAQEWKTGPEALALLRAQYRQTLDLLRSTEGANYARFVGVNRTEMIHVTRERLAALDRLDDLERDPEEEPEPDDDRGAYHEIDAWTNPDGSIGAVHSTNDDRGLGFPNDHAAWETTYRDREDFDRSAGRSRTGCMGVRVRVFLDGEEIT